MRGGALNRRTRAGSSAARFERVLREQEAHGVSGNGRVVKRASRREGNGEARYQQRRGQVQLPCTYLIVMVAAEVLELDPLAYFEHLVSFCRTHPVSTVTGRWIVQGRHLVEARGLQECLGKRGGSIIARLSLGRLTVAFTLIRMIAPSGGLAARRGMAGGGIS